MEYVKNNLGKPTCFAIIIVVAIILVIVSLICVCILFSRLPWHAICQTYSKSTEKYTDFIKSQMSSDELAFLDTLSISDSDFNAVYNRIN